MPLGGQNPTGRLLTALSRQVAPTGYRVVPTLGRVIDFGAPLRFGSEFDIALLLLPDMGITLGSTTQSQGTTPPAVTISGTATVFPFVPHFEIDSVAGGTARGQATFKWSVNGGLTYEATGVLTAASVVLGSTGVTAAFAVGPYDIDNKWDGRVSAWADQSGNGANWAQGTAANQPIYKMDSVGPYLHVASSKSIAAGDIFGTLTEAEMHLVMRAAEDPAVATPGVVCIIGSSGAQTLLTYVNGLVYGDFGTTARKNAVVNPARDLTQWSTHGFVTRSGEWTYHLQGAEAYTTATNTVGWGVAPSFGDTSAGGDFYLRQVVVYGRKLTAEARLARFLSDSERYQIT